MGLFSRKTKKDDFQQANLSEVTLSNVVSYQLAQQVDCTGYSCPRPQMMTKKAVNVAQTNDVVEIIVDNPSSMEAVSPMVHKSGLPLWKQKQIITPGESTLEKIDSALDKDMKQLSIDKIYCSPQLCLKHSCLGLCFYLSNAQHVFIT